LAHFPVDDGIVILDVWHSRDDFQKMLEHQGFHKKLEARVWPTKPQVVEV
jgi:hypothetical protein